MLALKPPTAALMVDMKNDRLKALVRFASVALSASMAPQDDAYIASESPDRTAVPTSSGRFVPTRANRTRVKLAMTPPRTTNRFLPYRSANPPKRRVLEALVMPMMVRIIPLVAKLRPSRTR